jgi:uncharacterized membrane protein YgcG
MSSPPTQQLPDQPTQTKKIDVSWPQVVSSALAAVSSAVLLSTVGVAGTVIGAAAGSVVVTVGTAVYRYSLEASRARVAAAQAAALEKVARARVDASLAHKVGVPDTVVRRRVEHAEEELRDAERDAQEGSQNASGPDWREALKHLPWKRVGLIAGAVFVIAMLVILGFELLTGKAVSDYTGGTDRHARTTLSGLTGGGSSSSGSKRAPSHQQTGGQTGGQPGQQGTPSPQPSGAITPSQGPVTEAPSSGATPTEGVTPPPSQAPTTGAPPAVTQHITPTAPAS